MSLKTGLRLTPARRISVHCPASREAQAALQAGDFGRLESEAPFADLFAVLRDHPEFGSVGPYRSVFELAAGRETFVPGDGATPSSGARDQRSFLATVVITTYVPGETSSARLSELVGLLAAAHPWELPVIEVASIEILR